MSKSITATKAQLVSALKERNEEISKLQNQLQDQETFSKLLRQRMDHLFDLTSCLHHTFHGMCALIGMEEDENTIEYKIAARASIEFETLSENILSIGDELVDKFDME